MCEHVAWYRVCILLPYTGALFPISNILTQARDFFATLDLHLLPQAVASFTNLHFLPHASILFVSLNSLICDTLTVYCLRIYVVVTRRFSVV